MRTRTVPTVLAAVVALGVVATLLVAPATSQAAGIISSLTVAPSQVNNGASATGTVSLAFPDPAPTTVLLFSDHPDVAQVPQSVVVPAGQLETSFTITTNAAAPATIVQITAWVGNTPRSANLSVNPAPPPGPTLSSVSVNPTSTTGGSGVTGTVSFTGPTTDGTRVQ